MRRTLAIAFATLALTLVAVIPTVDATQVVQRTWRAGLGTSSAHGSGSLTAYTDGTGAARISIRGLRANTTYTPRILSGTCARPGTVLATLHGIRTGSTGAGSVSTLIGNTAMNNVWRIARGGSIILRVSYGGSITCGSLGYYTSTRVRIPYLRIDLPVVRGPNAYPYCNVAMYQPIMWQPSEPGVTFIYAHARTGMFLPILTASKINNGAAMVGKLVYVYTSNSLMYTYRITKVDRHVTSIQWAVGITYRKLLLQTSEGTNYTFPKVVLEASPIAVTPVSFAAAHPTPHIVHCT